MPQPVISVHQLSKKYRLGERERYFTLRDKLTRLFQKDHRPRNPEEIWAIQDVSFEVNQGEMVGLIGRNGTGKTTLLKILSRITDPTEGAADIYGRVSSLLEVGTGFHPELTGRENIFLNGAILGMRRSEIILKFDEIVAFAEIEKFIDTPVKRYSSGMYMRLAFSVAAHLQPDILLVDEVLAVGDAAFQKKCLGKMSETAREGRTVLFVSHNMPAITRLCQRALLLDKGHLIEDGPALDVTRHYLEAAGEAAGVRTWAHEQAPGSKEVKLISVALQKKDGETASMVEVTESLKLRIGYAVSKPNLSFRCCAHFYTQGVCAFITLEPTEETRSAPGFYYSIVHIPPHLLSEGEYLVGITLFNSRGMKQYYVDLKEALTFQAFDPMTRASARGDYAQNMMGVLRPLLRWETVYEPSNISTHETAAQTH